VLLRGTAGEWRRLAVDVLGGIHEYPSMSTNTRIVDAQRLGDRHFELDADPVIWLARHTVPADVLRARFELVVERHALANRSVNAYRLVAAFDALYFHLPGSSAHHVAESVHVGLVSRQYRPCWVLHPSILPLTVASPRFSVEPRDPLCDLLFHTSSGRRWRLAVASSARRRAAAADPLRRTARQRDPFPIPTGRGPAESSL
jgi:hypothetical protein